jgi:hypothetical protein
VSNLTTTAGIVAIAAAAVAVIALLWGIWLTLALRRVRGAQRVVLGEGRTDLVDHAAGLQRAFEQLAEYVTGVAERLEARMTSAETRLDGAIAYRSLVRYDAYGEMSGRQSMSIALLDAGRSGVVLSSIHHRDTARLYAKQILHGKPELELSPEEADAVRIALGGAGAAA